MAERAQLRAVLGGPAFLHRGSLALLVPTSLLTSLLSRDIADVGVLVGWIVANGVAFLLCWGIVELADRTVFRRRAERPAAIASVVLFGAFLGAAKGSTTDLAGAALGLGAPTAVGLGWRSLGTAALGAVMVPALAALRVGVERARTEHALLVAQQLRTLDTAHATAAGGPNGLRTLAESIREELAVAASRPVEVSAAIRTLVDERLRPVMEALWAEGDRPPTRLDVLPLLRLTVVRNPFPVAGIAVAYAVSILPTSIELAGVATGIVRTVVAGSVLALTLLVARRLRPPCGASVVGALHLLTTIGVATALQLLQWDRLLGGMPEPSTPALWLTVAVWLSVLLLVGGALAIALRERTLVRAELLRVLGPDVLRDVALRDHDRLVAQRVATRLHADVQGRMLAAARRIERVGHTLAVVDAELADLDALLRDLPDLGRSAPHTPLPARLDELIDRWRGFLDVRVDPSSVDVAADVEGSGLDERVLQVVSEAVVNAVRHGLAGTAQVRLEAREGGVDVVVVDDGIGPRDGAPGLGSTYFASVSGGAWSLEPGERGGSVVRVHVTG